MWPILIILILTKLIKLFWDIDGTILETNGSAAKSFEKAVTDYTGQEVKIDRKSMSGFTDYEIANFLLKSVVKTVSLQDIKRVLEIYAKILKKDLQDSNVQTIGNVSAILNKLKSYPLTDLGIASGNIILGAKEKLKRVGLLDIFSDKNIFCASEKNSQRRLVFQEAKLSLRKDQVGIIIGDSLQDIDAAHKSGLIIISVPTGLHTSAELKQLNPNFILKKDWDFQDLSTILQSL
jgi:phosphoglycolate phosphatase-like HAD superfamily hydrolase